MGHGVMRPDHLAIMQAGNLFVFGLNNPVMWIDPSGLFVRRAWEATRDFIDEYHEVIIAGAAITAAAALTVATKGAAAPLLAKAAGTFGPVIEQGAKKAQQMGGLIQQAKTTGGGLIQDISTRVAPATQRATAGIKHSVYNDMRNKIGRRGTQQFIEAMNKGLVGPQGQSGIKTLSGKGVRIGGQLFRYEVKLFGEFANYRLFGNLEEGGIVFTHFGKALH